MANQFEVLAGTDLVATDINVVVTDPNGIAPALVIHKDDPWKITATWKLSGTFSTLLQGQFKVHAHIESMGEGDEKHVADMVVPAQMANPANYTAEINVPGGVAHVEPNDTSTAYKLVTLVTYEWSPGKVSAMAGYNEGPILQFYQDKP